MFLANLYLKSRPNPVQFFFLTRRDAMEAQPKIPNEKAYVQIVDDYGQAGVFLSDDFSAYLVVDFTQAIAAEVEKRRITQIVSDRFAPQQQHQRETSFANVPVLGEA